MRDWDDWTGIVNAGVDIRPGGLVVMSPPGLNWYVVGGEVDRMAVAPGG